MAELSQKALDPASRQMLEKAQQQEIKTIWDRYEDMQPQCRLGLLGICCRICGMGPCRTGAIKEGAEPRLGICGANQDTVAARNLVRMIAAGASAHSDHGRDIAHTLLLTAQAKSPAFKIADEEKLNRIAAEYGIESNGKPPEKIAEALAQKVLSEFGKQEDSELIFARRAPQKRIQRWHEAGIFPRSIDREIVETMHRTNMGVDTDYRNIIMQGLRCALADGWGGSMIATELSDVLFGSPKPIRAQANLGVLKADEVNIAVHGHEPSLSEVIVMAANAPELIEAAKKAGANGINVVGLCCTANEVLMRHGIPSAGNFLNQELAILTGAVEVMLVDVQCIMPSLTDLVKCFHTELITTSPKARFPGVTHLQFEPEKALEVAKEIIRHAIDNFKNRNPNQVSIPDQKEDLIAGFTAEVVFNILGGTYRATYRPLNNGIIEGRLRGVCAVVGCNSPRITQDYNHVEMVKELIRHDVVVLETGCSAVACAKAGLLRPEAAYEYAGLGLQEICEAVGIPPVLHCGSCVDNSRLLIAATNVVLEGGLGDDISELPIAAAAPEWMSEKAVAIGFYAVASGIFTLFGTPLPVLGSKQVSDFLCQELEKIVGAHWAFEADPIKAAHLIINRLNEKRAQLKLKPMMYEPVEPSKPPELKDKRWTVNMVKPEYVPKEPKVLERVK